MSSGKQLISVVWCEILASPVCMFPCPLVWWIPGAGSGRAENALSCWHARFTWSYILMEMGRVGRRAGVSSSMFLLATKVFDPAVASGARVWGLGSEPETDSLPRGLLDE